MTIPPLKLKRVGILSIFFLIILMFSLVACTLLRDAQRKPAATPALPVQATTAVAQSTPAPTRTSTPLATNTSPPPTSTSTPTIPPAQRLPTAAALQRFGDYERAVAEYAAILNANPDPTIAAEAVFQLGETYFLQGDYRMAVDVFNHFLQDYPQAERLPQVLFRQAVAHSQLGDWRRALDYYKRFAEKQSYIAAYVGVRIGEVYVHLGEDALAVEVYAQALASDIPVSLQRRVREELALIYRRMKKPDEAVAQYERVLELVSQDAYKARLEYEIASTWREAGRAEQAARRYKEIINGYPKENGAYQALMALLDMKVADVDPLQRGIVDYHAGQYKLAIEVLKEYLQGPGAKAAMAYLYIGLAQRQLGDWNSAMASFERIIQDYPRSELMPDAMLQRAFALQSSGENDRALFTYRWLLYEYPNYGLADIAWWRQAQLLQSLERREQASAAYRSLAARFPGSNYADRARVLSGLVHYQAGAYDKAIEAWEGELLANLNPKTRARLLFWSGKTLQALGRNEEARKRWEDAAATDPDGYYTLRARALRDGATPEVASSTLDMRVYDPQSYLMREGDHGQVEPWLKALGEPLEETGSLAEVRAGVRGEATYRRGQELLAVGAREEAWGEFSRLRDQCKDQPLALYALALDLQEIGGYRQAISCVERIIKLANRASLHEIPVSLLWLAYPVHYAELVTREAREYNMDPRLFLALMRQESLFDPYATSWAGARGLSQVMPTTGQWIAQKLGHSRFRTEDLYRPYLNVRYGLWYLAQALNMFERNIFGALAGYNGGPGNVKTWAGGLPIRDVDLFVENIAAVETKTYVMEVWRQYTVYCFLYLVS